MQILPSILEKDKKGFLRQIKTLSHYFQRFQIDIADGKLSKNKTVQIEEIIEAIVKEKLNIKHLIFEFHLMVYDFKREVEKILELSKLVNIGIILIHAEANPSPSYLIANKSFLFGLVLDVKDKVDDLRQKYDLNIIPAIQIMTVNIGYQGTPFLPNQLEKIDQLKEAGFKNLIYLDGAVNNQTIPLILNRRFKPNVLCPGSFLTKAEQDLKERVKYLKSV